MFVSPIQTRYLKMENNLRNLIDSDDKTLKMSVQWKSEIRECFVFSSENLFPSLFPVN